MGKNGGNMLVIKNVSKYYKSDGQTVQALKNVSLNIANKGFVVLLGKSGSGKSTLLNLISGLDSFDSGDIIIKDTSTNQFKRNDWDSYRNSYVGVVFQEFYLIEEFTVGKNIAIALELQGYPKDRIEEKVIDILNQVDLGEYKDKLPNQLSGGQKQRIAIARALVKDPKIILADEPTGNLDSENGKLILDILKNLSESKLVIMVTHNTDFAYKYGDRVIELKDGLVINDYLNIKGVNNQTIYDVDKDYKKIIKVPKSKKLSLNTINYINEILSNSDKKLYLSLINNKNYVKKYIPSNEDTVVDLINDQDFETSNNNEKFTIKKSAMPFIYALKLALNSIFKKKFRLTLMLLLFIASLTFLGISTSLSFYDVSKASTLTFKQANLNFIPIDKWVNHCDDDLNCRSFTKEEIASLQLNIKILTLLHHIVDISLLLI